MDIIIEIDEAVIISEDKNFEGREYTTHHQIGFVSLGRKFAGEFKIPHKDSTKPYPVGKYKLDLLNSLTVDKQRLQLKNIELIPASK